MLGLCFSLCVLPNGSELEDAGMISVFNEPGGAKVGRLVRVGGLRVKLFNWSVVCRGIDGLYLGDGIGD